MLNLAEIGERVRAGRKALNMTQSDLETASGVSRARIDAVENLRATDLGYNTVLKLLNALGLDLRVTTENRGRPTLEDLQAENEAEDLTPGMR